MMGDLQIRTDINMVDPVEDWSEVRSPGRARRRRARHKQRIRIVYVPKPEIYLIGSTLFMHPDMLARVRAQLDDPTKSPERMNVLDRPFSYL